MPLDGTIHRFEVEQEGFKTEKRTLMFDKPIDLTVELTKESATYTPHAKTAEPKATSETPTPPAEEPKKKPVPTVEIDESNPYKKKP